LFGVLAAPAALDYIDDPFRHLRRPLVKGGHVDRIHRSASIVAVYHCRLRQDVRYGDAFDDDSVEQSGTTSPGL
jgi:hypothetical protein